MARIALVLSLIATAAMLQGCVSTVVGATAGAAIGVTGAAVKTTAKGVGTVGRAVIPGGEEDERER
jgi:hypothetical protein